MAGIPINKIQKMTSAKYVIRCMPNPAAEFGLSYTPWIASPKVSDHHKKYLHQLFANLGESDEFETEEDIDFFTALTGSGEGLINYFALTMLESAVNYGLNPRVAEKAICQLFKGIGYLMVNSGHSIEETVANLIHYAGTTAAGINAMKKAKLSKAVAAGIQAAYIKAKKLNTPR
jgi:pyrroline-5-carboxylate reductase